MQVLKGKSILVISSQFWTKMHLSKHHYAIALAEAGNKVYYLNPPRNEKRGTNIEVKPSDKYKNLWIVDHELFFPYALKFKAIGIYHWLMNFHLKKLEKQIGTPIDIVWSFDLENLYPSKLTKTQQLKIFHPVDMPQSRNAILSGKGADIFFSVATEILERYSMYHAPKHFINHGLSKEFLGHHPHTNPSPAINVGFAGNILRYDIDRDTLLKIISENQNVVFNFWGSYKKKDSSYGDGGDEKTLRFIEALQNKPNVILHGVVSPGELANAFQRMDAFLICYDVKMDQSEGTNYHKIMEYLSTGKVIVSNNVTTYAKEPVLVQMVKERDNNDQLPALFAQVITRLDEYNRQEWQDQRRNYAFNNTYAHQVERIDTILFDSRLPAN